MAVVTEAVILAEAAVVTQVADSAAVADHQPADEDVIKLTLI